MKKLKYFEELQDSANKMGFFAADNSFKSKILIKRYIPNVYKFDFSLIQAKHTIFYLIAL